MSDRARLNKSRSTAQRPCLLRNQFKFIDAQLHFGFRLPQGWSRRKAPDEPGLKSLEVCREATVDAAIVRSLQPGWWLKSQLD